MMKVNRVICTTQQRRTQVLTQRQGCGTIGYRQARQARGCTMSEMNDNDNVRGKAKWETMDPLTQTAEDVLRDLWCAICKRELRTQGGAALHLNGSKHGDKVRKLIKAREEGGDKVPVASSRTIHGITGIRLIKEDGETRFRKTSSDKVKARAEFNPEWPEAPILKTFVGQYFAEAHEEKKHKRSKDKVKNQVQELAEDISERMDGKYDEIVLGTENEEFKIPVLMYVEGNTTKSIDPEILLQLGVDMDIIDKATVTNRTSGYATIRWMKGED